MMSRKSAYSIGLGDLGDLHYVRRLSKVRVANCAIGDVQQEEK